MEYLTPVQDTLKAAEYSFADGAGTYRLRAQEGRRYAVSVGKQGVSATGNINVQYAVGDETVDYENAVLANGGLRSVWVIATSQWVYFTLGFFDSKIRMRFIDVTSGA
jgi:hypothetical protein